MGESVEMRMADTEHVLPSWGLESLARLVTEGANMEPEKVGSAKSLHLLLQHQPVETQKHGPAEH